MDKFGEKISLPGSKVSSLNAPSTETPVSRPFGTISISPFSALAPSILPSSLWGNKRWFIMGGWLKKDVKFFGTKSA